MCIRDRFYTVFEPEVEDLPRPPRVRLYAQARQLTGHGRDRAIRPQARLSRQAHRHQGGNGQTGDGLAGQQESEGSQGQLAVHRQGRQNKIT